MDCRLLRLIVASLFLPCVARWVAGRMMTDMSSAAAIEEHEGAEVAAEAGLRYVSDLTPGFARRRRGKGFVYLDPNGRAVLDDRVLRRIRSLAVPPAWTEVWICTDPLGHLQATGRDARGRKQYRYHPRWRAVRDEAKFGRMIAFGHALPAIRARVDHDLQLEGLPREKVLAVTVRLLESTLIRVGNEEYARDNQSFGLTTLRDRHVEVNGAEIRFDFRGKGGKRHEVGIRDRGLARIVRQCQDLPGYELFQYLDDGGGRRSIDSEDVNAYLREVSGEDFTAKDFRTWAGTVLASLALRALDGEPMSEEQAKRNVNEAIEQVARSLRNTPTICRRCYVHPDVIEAYLDGTLRAAPARARRTNGGLRPEEQAVLTILERRARSAQPSNRAAR
jgi:DNA topoisomerase-1